MNSSTNAAAGNLLFGAEKRRYQGRQLMNFLLRPLVAPLIYAMAALRLRADFVSLLGMAAYGAGAHQCLQGTPDGLRRGALWFLAGLFAELVDGGLARLRGPSPLGHFLAKLQETLYSVLLVPCLALGLYAGGASWNLLLLGLFGAFAELLWKATVEQITSLHSAADLARLADGPIGGLKRALIAQLLPEHPSFAGWMRAARIVRENLTTSSGLAPLALAACAWSGRLEWFVAASGVLHLAAFAGLSLAKAYLLWRGGGRLFRA